MNELEPQGFENSGAASDSTQPASPEPVDHRLCPPPSSDDRPAREVLPQRRKVHIGKAHPDKASLLLRYLTYVAAAVVVVIIVAIIGTVLVKGVPHLRPSLFAWTYTSENVSLLPSLINTISVTVLALVLAVPLGVGAAIYLVEYARRGNKLVSVVRMAAEVLSGIPSIVYGLFGMLFFVLALGWGHPTSLLAGTATVAIMILPLVLRTTEEALLAVPDTYREASFGLGAGRLRTVFSVVLPAAIPGILSGVVLSIGRIVGETAALLFTAGTFAQVATNLMDSSRTLAVHMYALSTEGFYFDQAWATAVVLLGFVVVINAAASWLARKMQGARSGTD